MNRCKIKGIGGWFIIVASELKYNLVISQGEVLKCITKKEKRVENNRNNLVPPPES